MPAPTDPQLYKVWRENLSKSHKGGIPWNKGLTMPSSFKIKVGESSKAWWKNPANSQKILLRNKKVSLSKMGENNPMKRPEVAKKVSLFMAKRMSSDKNPMRRADVWAKISRKFMGHKVSQAVREKISKKLIGKLVGNKNPFWGRHHTLAVKEKSRVRAINMITSGLLSTRRTGIEIAMRKQLETTTFIFQEQVPLLDITVVDFLLPKYRVIIYCDGDYWHQGEWAKKNHIIRNDRWKTKVLESRGYKVFRFSETEINKSCRACLSRVIEFINNETNVAPI